MSIFHLFYYFTIPCEVVLFWNPSSQWLAALTLLVRFIVFGLLLRTYIVPWLFLRFSRHIRIRSVSLRSIRGLYVSHGNGTWGVERLSYSWSRVDGARHLTIKVEGLTGEISKFDLEPSISDGHKRSMTAVVTSAASQNIWRITSGIVSALDPIFRPPIRGVATYILRWVIFWAPGITSAVFFDIYPATFKFTGSLECEVTIEKVHLHTLLDFRQGQDLDDNGTEKKAPPLRSKKSFSMTAWKSRLTRSFERTWDRAIETREGVASFAVELDNLKGYLPSDSTFFRIPGAVTLHSTTTFDPKRRRLHTHALQTNINFEGCFVDVDVLHTLLQKYKASRPPAPSPKEDIPLLSPTLSFVSRGTTFLRSPLSADSAFSSIYSPSSPILESITASILPRRHGYRPCMKLRDTRNQALISFLDSIQLHMSFVSLSTSPNANLDSYRLIVEDINVNVGLSNFDRNLLHRKLAGRNDPKEAFDSDIYSLDMNVNGIQLTRTSGRDKLRLVNVGPLGLNIVTTQWPSPLLVTSPFLGGDPNAPTVLFKLGVDSVRVTDRLDSLLELVEQIPHNEKSIPPAQPSFSLIPVPRIEIEVSCGPIQAQLVVGSPERPHTIEMRTDGFLLLINSHFDNRYPLVASTLAEFDKLLLRMVFELSFIWKPTFIRIRSRQSKRASVVPDFAEDPALVSLDAIEAVGKGDILAEIRDDTQNTPSIDLSTLVSDINFSSDALCLELWHPEVLDALVELLEVLPSAVKKEGNSHKSLQARLPLGCSATVSLSRFVIFVTASELNPNDNLELSRGFALRVTGMSAQYCALHYTHLQRYKEPINLSSSRIKLFLPKERSVAAWEEAKRSAPISTFMSLSFLRLSLRSAISTQYSTDDPFIAERDNPAFENRDCLQMHGFLTDARLHGQGGKEVLDIMMRVPYVQAMVQVADVYSVMLAARTLKTLSTTRPRASASENTRHVSGSILLSLQVTATVDNLQAHFVLRNSKIFCRLDSLSTHLISDGPLTVGWDKLVLWTRVPAAVNRWQQRIGQKWEEFLTLQKWNVCLKQQPAVGNSVSVEGVAARVRIPFGFILADLVLDISVVIKALRHLHLITTSNLFSPFPKPEAEAPKAVPNLSVQVGYLSLEAADDPLETKLGRIFKIGLDAVKNRMDREDAFAVKVNNILATQGAQTPERDADWEFSTHHSVSIQDARDRLDQVHVLDWVMRLERLKNEQKEVQAELFRQLHPSPTSRGVNIPTIIPCTPVKEDPPLIRTTITNLSMIISRPTFPLECTPDFLFEQGQLPKDTQYSLLIPLHLHYSVSSFQVTLRDYPLAMVDIPAHPDPTLAALEFDTDLVIAEEMGTDLSIDWVECPIILPETEYLDVEPFYLMVPKTIMPVKTYANPEVKVTTADPTTFCWGVSYGPATQDLMRIVDTLSSSPRDPSPPLGFWDKLRLVFHWSVRTSFRGDIRLHMKGLRDPYEIIDVGAGFLYSWQGHTKLLIGRKNDDGELIQVISDSMVIAIPNLEKLPRKYPSSCRFFDFKPHYLVRLEKKPGTPDLNGPADSYSEFRSDFIHLSISLTASTRSLKPGTETEFSSLHLTPKTFTHFWSWWTLFDGVLSLPIRHGSYFPRRIISPKIGRHLATLKYRLLVPKLFVMHGYVDDSRETWIDGVTPWVGVKAMIEDFQVDMHQRDQEMTTTETLSSSSKVNRRKAFYAAEVVMKNLDLRCKEPSVPHIQMTLASERIDQLNAISAADRNSSSESTAQKMIPLLQRYVNHLLDTEDGQTQDATPYNYSMPADSVSADEWAEFDNVFQIHCPKLFVDSAVRDIMMQYYHCSRDRRGFEYHMATRAVKFIRDQAEAILATEATIDSDEQKTQNPAHVAASAIRKIVGDAFKSGSDNSKVHVTKAETSAHFNPMDGWSESVSLRKSHCCLLLKPQIVLRNRGEVDETCVVAALQAKLQSFAIMDDANADDPISVAKVMHLSARKSSESTGSLEVANHLHDETDLIQVQIPRFTVTASDHHFETISNIITRLLLYSDAAHKTRLDHLETVLFQYDFNDLTSSAGVILDLQSQMRKALDIEYLAKKNHRPGDEEAEFELIRLRAHMFLLSERLNFLFEAIKLAQSRRDRRDEQSDRKSATLLHASSSEISWRMVDENRDLLAKLAVQNIDFYWLRRQDSSTVNHLTVGDLQAFDGSRDATWAEILSKHDEPAYHPLLKRGLFVLSNWSVLPPVGGITIYESFEIALHPLRLQIDAKVGRRIMEYVYPARKHRRKSIEDVLQPETVMDTAIQSTSFGLPDSPRPHSAFSRDPFDLDSFSLAPPLRKLGASRSFTDLRSTAVEDSTQVMLRQTLQRTRSSENLKRNQTLVDGFEREPKRQRTISHANQNGDAAEMKTRSSRKTFVYVKISSLHLLLSVMKEDAFVCRDARIRTRDLEFRNQTLSFEELVNQFIPSDMSWKGWVKMAFQQPLVPVLPVARELISKTKWIASKSTAAVIEHTSPPKSAQPKAIANVSHANNGTEEEKGHETLPSLPSFLDAPPPPPPRHWKKTSHRKVEAATILGAGPLTVDPEPIDDEEFGAANVSRPPGRKRVLSLFSRSSSKSGKSETSINGSIWTLLVATANNLTNAANSILIPPFSFHFRKPVVALSPPPFPSVESARAAEEQGRPVLEDSLDRHVDDVMRRRDKIRRTLKGVWSFLKTPLGIVTGIYGFLVVFWGAAIVVFLLKIINFHNANTQGFWVEVSSQVVDGLFAVTGIGFIPFRVLDTYRISKIYSYKRRTRELRAKAGLPQLFDEDDLPDPVYDPNYVHVLTDEEQKDLHRRTY
ncbi:hypothetical protein HHX47_DHR5000618 [Lentinula edodes]|nr:hypothetical protein HHX47_DHR5000618 [Lentinula edodes]